MNKYKKLLSNTLIFAIGTFSSKVLVFLMLPFVTNVLSKSDYSTATLLQDMGNLLFPIFSLQIVDGIIRFGLDKHYRKPDVFTTGLISVFSGFVVLLLCSPLLSKISFLSFMQGREILVSIFVFTSSLRSVCSQFVRARNMVKLYAFDGILATFTNLTLTLLLLYPFHLGVTGYLLGIILSDALSSIFLFWVADLHKFVRFKGYQKPIFREMTQFTIPLIPSKICFWITNSSDRLMVANMLGDAVNGAFSAAYKIPNLITMLSSIFMDAWQMSAITEEKGRASFFTRVFKALCALIFSGSAVLILLCRPLMSVMTSKDYHEGWIYLPILVIGTAYACLCSFLGTIYIVEKKSFNNMVTTVLGAGANLILNFLLIGPFGPNGAAFATVCSYLIMFITRVIDTRRFIPINFNVFRITVDTLILVAESVFMIFSIPGWQIWCSVLTVFMLLINLKLLIQTIRKVIPAKKEKTLKK
ncbi:lipopolysaccharide biosynthesis protein [Caproicibacterium sp. BJN0003]|uniref:lipopolysaccharide biosynthesis protein n=1 Tax=Caproicibacterium sp. BJN0003 TaxID=2994078 RepID=UPI002256A797|nr:polysaccharide biosynthesis C-terminal domain-containing protein [Caproicibacterium sp. BJN0003]UZT82045.1 polysaccharide biosynthesis C-terminal domain-containing protein [Caproicibacterium sp. BJN0003]